MLVGNHPQMTELIFLGQVLDNADLTNDDVGIGGILNDRTFQLV